MGKGKYIFIESEGISLYTDFVYLFGFEKIYRDDVVWWKIVVCYLFDGRDLKADYRTGFQTMAEAIKFLNEEGLI